MFLLIRFFYAKILRIDLCGAVDGHGLKMSFILQQNEVFN